MKSSQLRGCSEDESSSSSLSSESLHLEDTAETRAFAIDSGNCSFDTSTESLDKHDVTDDELDIETTRRDFPQKESVDAHGLNQLKFRRVAVMSAFLLSMGGTGSLSYLYLIGILPELEDQWLCALILVALYILPMVAVMWYEFGCRFVIEKLRKTATNNTAIVNSLFPENVRSRMITEESRRIKQEQKRGRSSSGSRRGNDSSEREKQGSMESLGEIVSLGSRGKRKQRRKDKRRLHRAGRRLDNFVSSPANQTIETVATEATFASVAESPPDESDEGLIPQDILTNKPIADFFPHCTVLFADIVGFTAWSSVRDPTAVFTLLESLYSCFDGIARRLRVFKVETIGDCYVAATGLPEPMENHAIIMAQFARTCMSKMMQIVRALEKHLGPDTGDLSMRFGLHRFVVPLRHVVNCIPDFAHFHLYLVPIAAR